MDILKNNLGGGGCLVCVNVEISEYDEIRD